MKFRASLKRKTVHVFRQTFKATKFVKIKGDLQSDLRMCTNEPTFYDTNSLTMF
jgi:hypothetical protein